MFQSILVYKAKQFMFTRTISKKSLHILEDSASVCASGDIDK